MSNDYVPYEHCVINIYDVNQYVLRLMDYYCRTVTELGWCIREIVITVLYLIRNVIVISILRILSIKGQKHQYNSIVL